MIKISPSILSADFANLERDIRRISSADYVHVDVMDGLFVPNISIGIPVVKAIRPTTELPLDVHLMIERPVRYVDQFCDAGADIVGVQARQQNLAARRGVRGAALSDPGAQSDLGGTNRLDDVDDPVLVEDDYAEPVPE